MSIKYDWIIASISATAICVFLTGCLGLGESQNAAWVNYKYKRGTNAYEIAKSRVKKTCGDFAFKEGIRIDGVTYYEEESARQADKDYRWAMLGVNPRPPIRHQRQLDYFLERRYKCMEQRGWYWTVVEQG